MYIQPQFEESRRHVLHELIRRYPLATFVMPYEGQIVVNHFPLILIDSGEHGVLKGHIPKANTIWKEFGESVSAIAIFLGPNAYVTPSWYPSKQQHGKVVPTWNYVAVHAHGCPRAIHDSRWLVRHLNELTDEQENARNLPWKVSDAPAKFTEKMIEGIVGIEMPVSSIVGKWKLSQNRNITDKLGVADGLRELGSDDSIAMEKLITENMRAQKSTRD